MAVVVIALALLLAGGCAPQEEQLAWEKITSEPESFYEETLPTVRVVATPEQASELEEFLQLPASLSLVSCIDFDTYLVTAVFQGKKPTTGYSVDVIDVRLDGNVITIYARFLTPVTPTPGQIVGVGPMITSPYYVLKVRKTPDLRGEFTFVLNANGEEVMRTAHFIP